MRVLVVTFYYPPDLSAGSFRTAEFVRTLRGSLPAGSAIDVLTTLPNRYHSFSVEAPELEEHDGVSIRRLAVPAHESGMWGQMKAFRAFAWAGLKEIKGRRYDLVYATSSRMFTAFLGALCARRTGAPLYLDFRDVLNDSVKYVLRGRGISLLLPLLNGVERFTVRTASKVNLVSPGFLPYFQKRYPEQRFSVFTNGVDEEFVETSFSKPPEARDRVTKQVVYAGNIGQGQGLHRIVPGLAKRVKDAGFEFEIIGAGGLKHLLEEALEEAEVDNVRLSPPVARKDLLERYRRADVLFMHLNDFDCYLRVLPSKIFEYAATGKPILAGVAGYAAEFVEREVSNAAVVPPCAAEEAAEALQGLSLEETVRSEFIQRFSRGELTQALVDDCLSVAGPSSQR